MYDAWGGTKRGQEGALLGSNHKVHLYKDLTPAGLSTFSWGWGLPTLGCLCKATSNHRTSTETNRCLSKVDLEIIE